MRYLIGFIIIGISLLVINQLMSETPLFPSRHQIKGFFHRFKPKTVPITNHEYPLAWSNLIDKRDVNNQEYLSQLQKWDRHLSMVADHDELATKARHHFSVAQKTAFTKDPFPGLRFLAYEMAKAYAWYSHNVQKSPQTLASLAENLKNIIQLHDFANQLYAHVNGKKALSQSLQELYPHEELLDSVHFASDDDIDLVLITKNGILIPTVKNYPAPALHLNKNGQFIIAYTNGYCELINHVTNTLQKHEHAISQLLHSDQEARKILMNTRPEIASMYIATNQQQTIMTAPLMKNRLYSINRLDALNNYKAQRSLTGLEQRYLKELLASKSTFAKEYSRPWISNLAKLERQMLAMVALNDEHLNNRSPLTRYVSDDMLVSLHRYDFIDDHCRLR